MPALRVLSVNVATPLPSNAAMRGVPLSTTREAFPVGVPIVELTVTVTIPDAGYVTEGAMRLVVVESGRTWMVPLIVVIWPGELESCT